MKNTKDCVVKWKKLVQWQTANGKWQTRRCVPAQQRATSYFSSARRLFCRWFLLFLVLFTGCNQYKAYQHLDDALIAQIKGEDMLMFMYLQAAVDASPQDAYLFRQLGWAYGQKKDYDAAFEAFQTALRLEPAYLAVYQDLATIAEEQGDIEGVIRWLEDAVVKVPAYKDTYRDLARLYVQQERFQDAQTLLDTVVVQWPDATWAHFQLGRLYVHLKLPTQALASFEKVIALEPVTDIEYALFVEAHSALGNVYYDQENYEMAMDFFKKAIDLNPADHSSMNNLAWVYAILNIHLEEGIHLSHRSLRLNPNSPTYLDTLAELYFMSGDVERAVQIIRQAIALDPDQPELRAHLRQQLARFLASGHGKV